MNQQRILITGASSGIGAAAAQAFAAEGAVVGLCARRADRLEQTAEACRALGAQTHLWQIDLSQLDAIDGFATEVLHDMGQVDVLVNNAGAGRRKRMQHITVAEFEETLDLNFRAHMRLTLALLPQMLERDRGHIVNVGAAGTREFPPMVGSYIAAKAALDSFSEALYIDLAGTGVYPHLVIPGRTATDFGVARPGQEPPFPADLDTTDSAEDVAKAIVACLGSDDLESYTNDRVEAACQQKRQDFNGYMRTRRGWFAKL